MTSSTDRNQTSPWKAFTVRGDFNPGLAGAHLPHTQANCGKDDIKGSNRWQTFKRQNFVRKAAVRRWCSCCPWEAKKHSLHCGCLGRSFLEDWSISERDYWKKMWDIIHWRSTLYVFLLMWHETQSNIANHGTEWKVSLSCSYSKRLKLCTSKKRKHNSPLWKTKPFLSFKDKFTAKCHSNLAVKEQLKMAKVDVTWLRRKLLYQNIGYK